MSKTEQVPSQQQKDELSEDVLQMILEARRKMELLSKVFPVDTEKGTRLKIMFEDSLIAEYVKKLDFCQSQTKVKKSKLKASLR